MKKNIFYLGLLSTTITLFIAFRPVATNEFEVTKIPEEIQKLINEREEARKNKNFQKSDELREKISTLGFSIDDSPTGPKISRI